MDDSLMYRSEFYIGGKWTPGAGPDCLDIVSPATEEVVGRIPVAIEADIDRAVAAAREAFEGPWSRVTRAERAGDPRDPDTEIGPLVARRQQDRVLGYVQLAREEGARVVTGGQRPAHMPTGWYMEPTILAGVANAMRVAREEIFGPVVSFIPFEDDDDAVAIANDSAYGLGGGVWSADVERAKSIARRLCTGTVTVNGGIPPHPRAPFGGFKESGLGRELGVEGLQAYLEPKTIVYPL